MRRQASKKPREHDEITGSGEPAEWIVMHRKRRVIGLVPHEWLAEEKACSCGSEREMLDVANENAPSCAGDCGCSKRRSRNKKVPSYALEPMRSRFKKPGIVGRAIGPGVHTNAPPQPPEVGKKHPGLDDGGHEDDPSGSGWGPNFIDGLTGSYSVTLGGGEGAGVPGTVPNWLQDYFSCLVCHENAKAKAVSAQQAGCAGLTGKKLTNCRKTVSAQNQGQYNADIANCDSTYGAC